MASNTDPRTLSPYTDHRPVHSQNDQQFLTIPLHRILRNLALRPTTGDTLFPSSWSSLEIAETISVDILDSTNGGLQHGTEISFDKNQKKWSLRGDGHRFDYETLGVVASKQFGARAIQLPNQTNKIVAGIIDAHELIQLFSAPELSQDGHRVTIYNKSDHKAHFLSVVPSQNARTTPHHGGRTHEEATLPYPSHRQEGSGDSHAEQHFSYVLQSTLIQKTEEKSRV